VANDPLFSAQSWADAGSGGVALEPGLLLAEKYRLLRPAGFGGMGAVWVARNEATAAEVAVKVLVLSREGVDDEAIARFRREAHAAAQLYHRGIVRIFDLVELDSPGEEMLVLVMELLRGETLANEMDRKRRFSLEETLAIAFPLLSALAHAHAQGIVHRDFKPENVFLAVDPDGHVTPKILDFGISKLLQPQAPKITTDGAMLGTPNYMAPEQARGRADVDARCDIFSAGIVLYEMLSGANPFASGSYHSVVAAILERDPDPIPGLAEEVWRVLRRSLEKEATLRYADASELAMALKRATQNMGIASPDASGPFPSPPRAPQLSAADASVPPASREPEITRPSMHRMASRRSNVLRASIAGTAVGTALALAVIAVQVGRARESALLPVTPATAAVAHPGPVPPAAVRVDVPVVAAPAPLAPDSATSASLDTAQAVGASPSAVPAPVLPPRALASSASSASAPAQGNPGGASSAVGSVAHAKAPPAVPTQGSPAPPAPPASVRSAVVRDPGF
jgi:serine/threonine-protein kinase